MDRVEAPGVGAAAGRQRHRVGAHDGGDGVEVGAEPVELRLRPAEGFEQLVRRAPLGLDLGERDSSADQTASSDATACATSS